MENSKSCPLLRAAAVVAMGAGAGRVAVSPGSSACQGPVCAWFDAAAGRCAVLTMARGTR